MPRARLLASELLRASRAFPALLLTGPRRAGKTTLLRASFPGASWQLLEEPDLVARVRADPQGFLDELRLPAILDEIQNAPELLPYVRARIDRAPSQKGQWLMTGSQEAPLMQGVTESLAGRAATFQLLPFGIEESPRVSPLLGGFPEVVARPRSAGLWFRSYVQTYLERDVRAVTGVRDLPTFRRFLAILATRTGTLLNRSELAGPLGVSVPTITSWLSVLEVTGEILVVPPWFENLGKRLVKSPKLYWMDSGLACHLLGIETTVDLERSPFLGAIWEGFVAAEIAKAQQHRGRARELYWFRDQQGLEVDFLVPRGQWRAALVEAKASRTALPEMARPIQRLRSAFQDREARDFVVHRPTGVPGSATRLPRTPTRDRDAGGVPVAPHVRALDVGGLIRALFH